MRRFVVASLSASVARAGAAGALRLETERDGCTGCLSGIILVYQLCVWMPAASGYPHDHIATRSESGMRNATRKP